MTTDYPSGTTPTGPQNTPPGRDGAWGCVWWWWVVIIIIILIIWWAGCGWGPSGGYWFRSRPAPGPAVPATRPTGAAAGPGAAAARGVQSVWPGSASPPLAANDRLS